MSISFIVISCINNDIQLKQLQRCINSLVNYSNYNYIYIISNSTNYSIDSLTNLFNDKKNITVYEGSNKKAETGNAYELILNLNDGSDYYCVFQDSMVLNKSIKDISYIKDVQFLWHFTNHRLHWDAVYSYDAETPEFDKINNIKCHTDLIKYQLKLYCNKDEDFVKYALHALDNKHLWCGCFGTCSIIKKEVIQYLNDKCGIVSYLKRAQNKRDRTVEESIFALVCHYYFPQNYENSFDGLYYDGITVNRNNGVPLGEDNLYLLARNEYLSKVSFGR
jgi:hypothetical protein